MEKNYSSYIQPYKYIKYKHAQYIQIKYCFQFLNCLWLSYSGEISVLLCEVDSAKQDEEDEILLNYFKETLITGRPDTFWMLA